MTERGIATLLVRGYGVYLMLHNGAMLVWLLISFAAARTGAAFPARGDVDLTWYNLGWNVTMIVVGIILLVFSNGIIRHISTPPGAVKEMIP